MRKRLRILYIRTGWFLGAGLFYAFLCFLAGKPFIPCMFHVITGLSCPGCGISRMCLALLRLDVKAAMDANAAVMLLLPAGIIIALQMSVRYVRYGKTQPTPTQTIILSLMGVTLVVFGILRNLGLPWLIG